MRTIPAILGCTVLLTSTHVLAWHYVSTTGSNQYPYRSWDTAARSIQDAIDASLDEPPPDPIVVAPGHYVGNITLPEGIEVRGAGAGSCTIRGVPPGQDYWSSVVFVDAGSRLSGFTVDGEGCWNGVICYGGLVRDCRVLRAGDGLRATDAFIDRCALLANPSAGIFASGVTLVHDTVVSGSSTGAYGIGQEYVLFLHCTISGNRTGVDNIDTLPIGLRDSIVWGNTSDDVYSGFSAADVVGCVTGDPAFAGVNGNISADPLFVGWGEFNTSDNALHVDCSNTGEQDGTENKPFRTIGAALRAYDFHLAAGSPCIGTASDGLNMGAYPYDVPTRERSPSVLINVAPGTYSEGQLMLLDGTHLRAAPRAQATISPPEYDTALWLNGNGSIDGFSIGVDLGTAVVCGPGSNPVITRCRIFPYALDEYSAAVRAWDHDARATIAGCVVEDFETAIAGSALVEGCTLADNKTAVLGPDHGDAPQIRNSIVWSGGPDGACALVNVPASNISHCLVSDPSLDGVNGNIFADPQFIDPDGGDFRLRPDSPCVDAGDNGAPELPDTDIVGMHRILYGGKSLTADMGAYEYYINDLEPGPEMEESTLAWSSLADRTYSIFYTDDLLTWHLADENIPSSGNTTTSWTDDGSKTGGIAPLLAPRRFYRILENP